MRVVKAPNPVVVTGKSVFLSGSIDMGKAVDWQTKLTNALSSYDCTIINPRRDDWDSSWKQDISDPKFREQVEWELKHLEEADIIAVYFDPKGQAPITLLELGIFAKHKNIAVCCPEGFWRRGIVQIVCNRYKIPLMEELDTLIAWTKARVQFG